MEPTIQRWSAKRKVEVLLQLIRGEKKLVDVCREHDLKQSEVEAWMDTFVRAGERLRWFPSWTRQGTAPESGRRDDGDEGVPAVDGAAEG